MFVSFICAAPAEAHSPYFKEYSPWLTHAGQEYQLQGWYGDGIFFSDPVRVILKHRNGGMSAVTGMEGSQASSYCPTLDFCWGFTFDSSGIFPIIWRLDPSNMILIPEARDVKEWSYPETTKIDTLGFKISFNYFMLPLAWLTLLPSLTSGLILVLPVFLPCLIIWQTLKALRKRDFLSKKALLKKTAVGILFLFLLVFGVLSVMISLFYGLGFFLVLVWSIWWGIGKLWLLGRKTPAKVSV